MSVDVFDAADSDGRFTGGLGGPGNLDFLLFVPGDNVFSRDLPGGSKGSRVVDSKFELVFGSLSGAATEVGTGMDRSDGVLGRDEEDFPLSSVFAFLVSEESAWAVAEAGTNSNSQTGHSTGRPRFLSGIASFPLQFGQRSYFIGS